MTVCGEMAADPLSALVLLGFGLRRFSMNPIFIPRIKKALRSVDLRTIEQVVEEALSLKTAQDVEEYLIEQILIKHPKVFLTGQVSLTRPYVVCQTRDIRLARFPQPDFHQPAGPARQATHAMRREAGDIDLVTGLGAPGFCSGRHLQAAVENDPVLTPSAVVSGAKGAAPGLIVMILTLLTERSG